MPDMDPYIQFFEAVARGQVGQNRSMSVRLFQILAMREKLHASSGKTQDNNPVDAYIKKSLCYYREQKEPLAPVAFDDPKFVQYMKSSILDLEKKVNEAILEWEVQKAQRNAYQNSLEKNHALVESLKRKAEIEADRTYRALSDKARRKTRIP